MSETATETLNTLAQNMERLLKLAGEKATCKFCGATIWWVKHKVTGARTPYEQDGTPHLIRCVNERYEKFREQYRLT